MEMKWHNLLSEEKIRKSGESDTDDKRSIFEKDYDRAIFCSSFRRLQSKTQVFPLEQQDYVRSRLTHSLEVSCLGRSFGKEIGQGIVDRSKDKEDKRYFEQKKYLRYDIAFIVATACLLHDVGNPPFGHFGESSIQSWFENFLIKDQMLNNQQKLDLLKFDGNAQSFRILLNLQRLYPKGGLNCTFATIASMQKYPFISTEIYQLIYNKNYKYERVDYLDNKNKENVCKKKHGCFYFENEFLKKLKRKIGIVNRHPLAFLVEAADDIANSAADVEDAYKKNIISFDLILLEFKKELNKKHQAIIKLKKYYTEGKKEEKGIDNAILKFRIYLQGFMFRKCITEFFNNYEAIMSGEFKKSLIESDPESSQIYRILKNCIAERHIYNDKRIIMIESIGYKVIHGLLDIFENAILENKTPINKKYYNLISPNFRQVMEQKKGTIDEYYSKLELLTDFVCGMTDNYALDMYQKLSGIRLV